MYNASIKSFSSSTGRDAFIEDGQDVDGRIENIMILLSKFGLEHGVSFEHLFDKLELNHTPAISQPVPLPESSNAQPAQPIQPAGLTRPADPAS